MPPWGDGVGGEVEDQDRLHAEEREAFPDLQAGEVQQAPGPAEEGVVVTRMWAAVRLALHGASGHGGLPLHKSLHVLSYQLIKNIPLVIGYRPGVRGTCRWSEVGRGTVGARGDRNVTGYADLSDGSDTSTNRVIDRMIDRVRHVIVSRQENLS
jgi:hypothetical protein